MGHPLESGTTPAPARSSSGPPAGFFDWRTFDPATLPNGVNSPLAAELVTFRDRLDEMLAEHEGEHVVIKGDQIVGYHPDRESAVDAVFDAFGREPALVKQVLNYDPVRYLNSVTL